MHIFLLLLLTPLSASAQTATSTSGLQGLIGGIMGFIDVIVIPFLLAAGFLFFLINVIRYFVLGSSDEDGRKKAKNLAIYSVLGFVLLIIFWGIINLIVNSIGLGGVAQPEFDYKDPDSVRQTGIPQSNNPENILPSPGDSAEANGNVACETTLPSGGRSVIITSPADCAARSGNVVGNQDAVNEDEETSWFDRLFRTYPRQFRDYFWADWNNDSRYDDNRERVSDYPVQCLLPDGTIEAMMLSECLDRGGEPVNQPAPPATGNDNSYELIDCPIFDATTGERRIIQATAQDCYQFGDGSDNDGRDMQLQ